MAAKTNAVRLLDSLNITYELREYEVDPEDLSAEKVAEKIGFVSQQVFKTLAVQGDRNGVSLAVIPGAMELDLKALAKLTSDRKVDLAPLKEVQNITGYIRGAVTALACRKEYPVYLDESVWLWDVVSISGGKRGLQVLLSPDDYVKATGAVVAAIAREK